jgi:hypothetical protein
MVYLLHFDRPLGNPAVPRSIAQHYIGYSKRPIEIRMREHRSEKVHAAALVRAFRARGIGFTVARTWPEGDRELEKKYKRWNIARDLCPICQAKREIDAIIKAL